MDSRKYRKRQLKRDSDSSTFFYRNKVSLDACFDGESGESLDPAWLSDGGEGTESMLRVIDYDLEGVDPEEAEYERRKHAAIKRVRRTAPHCLKTLLLIFKNKNDREESICQLMLIELDFHENERKARRKYNSHLQRLCGLFGVEY